MKSEHDFLEDELPMNFGEQQAFLEESVWTDPNTKKRLGFRIYGTKMSEIEPPASVPAALLIRIPAYALHAFGR
ncbi:hypothetical protein [Cupriavidus sp. D39]|uniref:hypothetical protein n=1 Tax=Cupriavidus sp. D39 TaxID=2997877 RepID=UPI00226EABAD|nr:hypothetical protein [Cupriavidus sp. D39]MCY0854963.1 hypothetical protein [Cupriavidus sp. D39]